jgi:D-aminoacyl-tRNA deacylase
MKVILQRVTKASVKTDNKIIAEIAHGFLILFGVTHADEEKDADQLAEKIVKLRICSDEENKMNKNILDVGGSILVVSQFTLYADCKKGNRPSFIKAAEPEKARKLYEYFIEQLRESGIEVQTGSFGNYMDVELVNDGPVTIVLDT